MSGTEEQGLTPEELAAMQDDDTIEDGDEEEEQPDSSDEPEEQAESEASDEEQKEDDSEEPETAAAAIAEGEEEQPGRDDGEDEQPQKAIPVIQAEMPDDYDNKLKALDDRKLAIRTERRAVTDKYEDGDITSKEYHDQLDKLEDELSDIGDQRSELKLQANNAQQAEKVNKAQADAVWYSQVELFMADHPEVTRNQTLMNVYDQIVQTVTAETMAAGKRPGMADLKKAYDQWAEDLGYDKKPQASKPDANKPEQKAPPKPRNVPPTLAGVPAADATDVENGKFASLDRLADSDPIKYQDAIDRLSPAERDAYNQYAG